jgi:hypothetical protein
MKLDESTQPGWRDATDYLRDRRKKYSTFELTIAAVVHPQTEDDAPVLAPTTFEELRECLDIIPGISQMPHSTSSPGSGHTTLGLVMLLLNTTIPGLHASAEHNITPLPIANPVDPVSFYHCI